MRRGDAPTTAAVLAGVTIVATALRCCTRRTSRDGDVTVKARRPDDNGDDKYR